MSLDSSIVIAIVSFVIIALASERIGRLFAQIKLPMISGFLLVGILAGPFLLRLISTEAIQRLSFLDDIALGFIAFAAGSELHIPELRSRLKSIRWVTAANSIFIPVIGGIATFWLADLIPFMQPLPTSSRIAIALLAGSILVARSPSSAIAIVNELRARGPFTRTILGVIMVSDVVIIILFAIAVSTAHALINSSGLQIDFVLLLLAELLVSFALGYLLGKLLHLLLALRIHRLLKAGLILLAGYSIFLLAAWLRQTGHEFLPFEFAVEPLLICMIGGFVVTNYSPYRTNFLHTLHDVGPPIYVIFFTLTGAAVRLDIFMQLWAVALILFGVRLVAIFVSSYLGGWLAGDPAQHNRLSWMAYVTQAGVALGLSREISVEFSEWGVAFATMMISTIVLSQLLGPPLFKFAIQRVGESHLPGPRQEFDGVRDAVIFGLEGQSVALARQLNANGWNVKIATQQAEKVEEVAATDINVQVIPGLTLEAMHPLNLKHADAVVAMESNDVNYQICELIYENFGIDRIIVRLSQLESSDRFAQLGAIVVEPATAMVGLLDQFVRAPMATSLLLDRVPKQRMMDLQVTNPSVHGMAIRDLRIPLDVLIVSVTRNGVTLVSHGDTRLELDDDVTVTGSPEGLEQVLFQLVE